MVQRLTRFFNTEITNVHNAAAVLGAFALLSQFLALFRDRLLAASFGAGVTLDLYYASFRIPDLLFVSVASLVSVSVLVPFIINKATKEETKLFIDRVFSFFLLLIVAASVLLFVLMPVLVPYLFPGFDLEAQHTVISLSRILLLSPFFLGLSNLLGGITQAHNRFILYAISPVLYNVGIIMGILLFVPLWGISGLVMGVVLGAFLHMLIQIPAIISVGLLPRFTLSIDWKEIRAVLSLSAPRTFTLATNHIATLVFISLASFMTIGSIAVFNLSLNLQSVPLAIVGMSYSLAAFPTLSRLYKDKQFDEFIAHIGTALRHILFWSIPISVYFIVLRAQIVRVILGSGQFGWDDTRLTAAALAIFALSIVAQSSILLFVRAFYAGGYTKKPFVASSIGMVFSIVAAYVGVYLYQHNPVLATWMQDVLRTKSIEGGEVLLLPLGFTIGQYITLAILWAFFEYHIGNIWASMKKVVFEVLGSAVVGGIVAYAALNIFASLALFSTETVIGIFLQGFLAGIAGIAVNLLLLYMLGSAELSEITSIIHRKIWKNTAVISDMDVV